MDKCLVIPKDMRENVLRALHFRHSGREAMLKEAADIPWPRVHKEIVEKAKNCIVTAACPYPALRLDKLYAALIRCLVLWTVTKQFLVFLFKGLYLLTGGSDVTRGISCDSALH